MAPWGVFAESAPHLARIGRRLFEYYGIGFLATVRRDGSPRIHPVVPIVAHGALYTFVAPDSPKRWDLLNDGRFALHAPLGQDDEEFMLAGIAMRVLDDALCAQIADVAPFDPHSGSLLFELRIHTCHWTIWENVGQPDTRPVREAWRAR